MTIPEAVLERMQQAADLLDQISMVDIPDAMEGERFTDVLLAFQPVDKAVHRYQANSHLAKVSTLRG